MKIDLHMHSTFSDGHLTPTNLVRLLARRGLDVAALTDHDSTEGLDEATAEAERHSGLRIIPGVEISASHPSRSDADVHVLGYFVDHTNVLFRQQLLELRDERDDRGQRMLAKLAALGYPLEWERVKQIAEEAGVGRPHIAQAMVERGYLTDYRQAFDGLLNDGGTAFVGRSRLTMEGAAEMINAAGGVAVLAHPLYYDGYERLLPTLADMGIAGFEAHYAQFSTEQQRGLLALAERYDMLPCGGSDYHATDRDDEALPGTDGPPLAVLEELERRAAASRG